MLGANITKSSNAGTNTNSDSNEGLVEMQTEQEIEQKKQMSVFNAMLRYIRYTYLVNFKDNSQQIKSEDKVFVSSADNGIQEFISQVEVMNYNEFKNYNKRYRLLQDVQAAGGVGKYKTKYASYISKSKDLLNLLNKFQGVSSEKIDDDLHEYNAFKIMVSGGLALSYFSSQVSFDLRFQLVEYALQRGQNPFAYDGILGNLDWLPNWLGITGQTSGSNSLNVIKLNKKEMSLSELAKLSQGNSSNNEFNFWHWFVKQSFSLYSGNNLFDLFSLEQIYGWFGDKYFDCIRGFYEEKFGKDFNLSLINKHLLKALSSIKEEREFIGGMLGFAFSASVTSSFLVIVIPSFWIFLTIPVGTLAGYGIGKLVGKLKCDKISSSKDCYHTGSSISSGYSSDSNMSLNKERNSGNDLFSDEQKEQEKQGIRENNSRKKTNFTSSNTIPLVVGGNKNDDNKNNEIEQK